MFGEFGKTWAKKYKPHKLDNIGNAYPNPMEIMEGLIKWLSS